jgi:CHAD domain-containing protein
MSEGKWIEGLKPGSDLVEAARRVLSVRLAVVEHHMPHTVQQAHQDPEHVHQLRVSTRRADAALRIFRSCLPKKVYKAARKCLRVVRRAAGAARDWDVFLLALQERRTTQPAREHPGLEYLVGYATAQRVLAQTELATAIEAQGATFADFVAQTVQAVRMPEPAEGTGGVPEVTTLIDLARPMLRNLLHNLEQAAGGDLKDYDQLHQVRIAGKRLRYALEVFAEGFGPELRESLYPQVEEMQEILGRANDSHVGGQRLNELREQVKKWAPGSWERVRPGLEGLLRYHQRRLPQERRRFLKWWERWRAAEAERVLGLGVLVGG